MLDLIEIILKIALPFALFCIYTWAVYTVGYANRGMDEADKRNRHR